METIMQYIPLAVSAILLAALILTVITNIITQVVKKITWDKIPTNILAVVILRYFAGYTQAETARALNIPQGTAATRQRRALQLLRLELGEEGDA